ncbi:hypothetical protein [Clostridium baratii]|uniref:hypothetical protein n=1 Tax=Clostridium baratii TaxID=1561 RepID=UPI0030D2FA2E
MRELLKKRVFISGLVYAIAMFYFLIAIELSFKVGIIEMMIQDSMVWRIILILIFTPVFIFIVYYVKQKRKLVDSYKLEEVKEYSITNKQYFDLINSMSKNKSNINELAINNVTNQFEDLSIAIDISKELGIKDNSNTESDEKIIRIEVYKPYIDKEYLSIEYPKKIEILREINGVTKYEKNI